MPREHRYQGHKGRNKRAVFLVLKCQWGSHREVEWTTHICMRGCPFKVAWTVFGDQSSALLKPSSLLWSAGLGCEGFHSWYVNCPLSWPSALPGISQFATHFGSPSRELIWIICQSSAKLSIFHFSSSQLLFPLFFSVVSSLLLCFLSSSLFPLCS